MPSPLLAVDGRAAAERLQRRGRRGRVGLHEGVRHAVAGERVGHGPGFIRRGGKGEQHQDDREESVHRRPMSRSLTKEYAPPVAAAIFSMVPVSPSRCQRSRFRNWIALIFVFRSVHLRDALQQVRLLDLVLGAAGDLVGEQEDQTGPVAVQRELEPGHRVARAQRVDVAGVEVDPLRDLAFASGARGFQPARRHLLVRLPVEVAEEDHREALLVGELADRLLQFVDDEGQLGDAAARGVDQEDHLAGVAAAAAHEGGRELGRRGRGRRQRRGERRRRADREGGQRRRRGSDRSRRRRDRRRRHGRGHRRRRGLGGGRGRGDDHRVVGRVGQLQQRRDFLFLGLDDRPDGEAGDEDDGGVDEQRDDPGERLGEEVGCARTRLGRRPPGCACLGHGSSGGHRPYEGATRGGSE